MRCSLVLVVAATIRACQGFTAGAFPCTTKTTPPAGSICGLNGGIGKPAIFESIQAPAVKTDKFQCRDKCLSVKECISYSWNFASSTCTFYTELIGDMKFTKSATSQVQYQDRRCFNCSACQPIFDNPGFEDHAMLSPWFVERSTLDTVVKIVSPGFASNNAVSIAMPPLAHTDISQIVFQCNGSNYGLQFDYQFVTSADASITAFVNPADSHHTLVFQVNNKPAQPGVWKHGLAKVATAHADGLIDIRIATFGKKQTVLLDNFQYLKI